MSRLRSGVRGWTGGISLVVAVMLVVMSALLASYIYAQRRADKIMSPKRWDRAGAHVVWSRDVNDKKCLPSWVFHYQPHHGHSYSPFQVQISFSGRYVAKNFEW
jgi:hypothetical protein